MSNLELTFEDVIEFIKKIPDYEKITLVGGQALCFWQEYYAQFYSECVSDDWLVSTSDIDFMANQDTLRECAKAWNAKPEIPSKYDHTANSGIILIDYDGEKLRIDFLWDVQGLTKSEIKKQRLKVIIPGNNNEEIPFYILSPYLCLVSRISNILILRRTDNHSIEQLKASIEVLNFQIIHLLENNNEEYARDIVEKVFNLACSTSTGIRVFAEHDINIFQAIPEDDRFTEKFRKERFPRMKKILSDKQTKKINSLHSREGTKKD